MSLGHLQAEQAETFFTGRFVFSFHSLGIHNPLALSTLLEFRMPTKIRNGRLNHTDSFGMTTHMKLEQRMQPIQLILSDVDGVMTDGRITYDNQGIETKSFHVRDGLGIKLWQRAGHHFGILTARTSHIVKLRASELGVEILRQGVEQKYPVAMKIIASLGLTPKQVCYIGDDLADLEVMKQVGLPASVSDGAAEVRGAAKLVTKAPGGRGAIRELIETILENQKRWTDVLVDYSNS